MASRKLWWKTNALEKWKLVRDMLCFVSVRASYLHFPLNKKLPSLLHWFFRSVIREPRYVWDLCRIFVWHCNVIFSFQASSSWKPCFAEDTSLPLPARLLQQCEVMTEWQHHNLPDTSAANPQCLKNLSCCNIRCMELCSMCNLASLLFLK